MQYLVQPETLFGSRVDELLELEPRANYIVWVSAFSSYNTLVRYRPIINRLLQEKAVIRFILGIDLKGTSKEALEEVISWGVDARIIKNRINGCIFHPKIFLFQRDGRADIMVGSNNLTDTGFYSNYECGVQTTYDLPEDEASYKEAQSSLSRFLDPHGPTCQSLSMALLERLLQHELIPLESQRRDEMRLSNNRRRDTIIDRGDYPFGSESITRAPLRKLVRIVELQRTENRSRQRSVRSRPQNRQIDQPIIGLSDRLPNAPPIDIHPISFFMELPTMRGKGNTNPGEPRIPLSARDMSQSFWGWPERYIAKIKPKTQNEYKEWYSYWRIFDIMDPEKAELRNIRLYFDVQNSDHRFYARPLLNFGADEGDIIRITRISEPNEEFERIEFECALAHKDTVTYTQWRNYCTEASVGNRGQGSRTRHWGYYYEDNQYL